MRQDPKDVVEAFGMDCRIIRFNPSCAREEEYPVEEQGEIVI